MHNIVVCEDTAAAGHYSHEVHRETTGTADTQNQMIEQHALSPAMQIPCYKIQKHHISICCYTNHPIKINKVLHNV